MLSCVGWQCLLFQIQNHCPAHRCSLPFPSPSLLFPFLHQPLITWCMQGMDSPRLLSTGAHTPVASCFSVIPCSALHALLAPQNKSSEQEFLQGYKLLHHTPTTHEILRITEREGLNLSPKSFINCKLFVSDSEV